MGDMKQDLLLDLREGRSLSLENKIRLIVQLSLPSILSQFSIIVMEYIDASMVGRLGANDSASIGLVSSTTWLLGGVASALSIGFTVQIAQLIGASKFIEARRVMKQGILVSFLLSLGLLGIGVFASGWLPIWLGGNADITHNATMYLRVYSCFIPFSAMRLMASGSLQSSGNMKVPSALNIIMCFFDVFFNFFFIFPTRTIFGMTVFGFGYGVAGAALGTGLSEALCSILMMYFLLKKSDFLHLRKNEPFKWEGQQLKNAAIIGLPVALESTISCSAYIAFTKIVAPLGTISIAANSFSITAEGLCYMPGYGIGVAATTIIGQSIGAKRDDLTKGLGYLVTLFGSGIMAISGLIMYCFAPFMISILTPDPEIQRLAVMVLRIEAFAEPLYGASIICAGVLRGAGDTLVSTVLNFLSMWCVRIPLAYFLSLSHGLRGVWLAMCIELWVRGIIFLIRLSRNKWVKNYA